MPPFRDRIQQEYQKLIKSKLVGHVYHPTLGELLWEIDLCNSTLEVAALAKELVSIEETLSKDDGNYDL